MAALPPSHTQKGYIEMLIRPHNTKRLNMIWPERRTLAEKTTFKRFNSGRSKNPSFFRIEAGDVFATWLTLKAFQHKELPTYYEWNGSKLVKTTSPQTRIAII
jgi:hypothetical protein